MISCASFTNAILIRISDAELADLSRIFCEVMHDFRSDLLPTPEFVQVHQHVSNIIQHKAGSNVSLRLERCFFFVG